MSQTEKLSPLIELSSGDLPAGVALLEEADAQALPFLSDRFDTVVCTYSLCNIPDEAQAVTAMKRVVERLVAVKPGP